MKTTRNLIIVGDRVLIDMDERHSRTSGGLYLPPTVKEKEKVQAGYVVKVGPGYPVHDPNAVIEEPWSTMRRQELKFVPLQAAEGDYAIFLREAAVEIEFEGKKYLIVPHSAILVLVRTELVDDHREDREDLEEIA
jgi:co-chaperonin GroES (HSP10)